MMHEAKDVGRWIARWSGRLLVALLVLVLGLLLPVVQLLERPATRGLVARELLPYARAHLPGLRIGQLRWPRLGRLIVEDVELTDRFGGEALRAARLELVFDPWALLGREVSVERLRVERPRVIVAESESGELNLAELATPTPAARPPAADGGPPLTVRVERLVVERGAVELRLGAAAGRPSLVARDIGLRAAGSVGLARYDVSARLTRLSATLRGAALPPRLRQLSVALAARLRLSGPNNRLRAAFAVASRGLGPRPLEVRGRVRGALGATSERGLRATLVALGAKTAGEGERQGGRLELAIPDADGPDADGELAPSAVLSLVAQVALGERTPLAGYVATLGLHQLDPGRFLAGAPRGELTAQLQLVGSGTPLSGGRAAAWLAAGPGELAGVVLGGAWLAAQLEGERWRLPALAVISPGGRLEGQAHGDRQGFSGDVALRVPRLSAALRQAQAVEGGADLPTDGVSGRLRARVGFEGRVSPASLELAVSAVGEELRLPGQQLALEKVQLDASLSGLLTRPVVAFDAGARRLRIGETRLSRLELVGRFDGRRGRFVGSGRGRGASAALRGRLRRAGDQLDVTLTRLALEAAKLRVVARAPLRARIGLERGRLRLRGPAKLALLGGRATIEGRYDGRGGGRLKVTASELDLERLPRVGARLAPLGRVGIDADLSLRRARVEGTASVSTTAGDLSLKVDAPLALLRRPRRLRRRAQLELRVEDGDLSTLTRLAALPRWSAGKLGGWVSLTSSRRKSPRLEGELRLRDGAWGRWEGLSATASLRAGAKRARLAMRAQASAGAVAEAATSKEDKAGAGAPLTSRLELTVEQSLGQLLRGLRDPRALGDHLSRTSVEGSLKLASSSLGRLRERAGLRFGQHVGSGSGPATLVASLKGTLRRPELRARLELEDAALAARPGASPPRPVKSLELSARLDGAASSAKLGLDLSASEGSVAQLELRSSASLFQTRRRDLTGELELRAPALALARRLVPALRELRGALSGKLALERSGGEPRLSGELSLRNARIEQVAIGDWKLEGGSKGQKVTAKLKRSGAGSGRIDGQVEVKLSDLAGSLRARLNVEELDLAAYAPLLPLAEQLDGELSAKLELKGTSLAALRGELALTGGRLIVAGVPKLTGVELRLNSRGDRVNLETLKARLGGGKLDVEGSAQLKDEKLELKASFDDVPLLVRPVTRSRLSAKANVKAQLRDGVAHVEARLREAKLELDKLKTASLHPTGRPQDVRFASEVGASEDDAGAAGGLGLQLDFAVDPLLIRGERANVEAVAELQIFAPAGAAPKIAGTAKLRRGRIEVLGKRFRIERARVDFHRRAKPDPSLDIELSRRTGGAKVFLTLTGTARHPELQLRSDNPSYGRSQLVSMVATGRSNPGAGGTGGGAAGMVATAITDSVLGGLVGAVAPKLGLDVARLSVDDVGGVAGTESSEDTALVRARAEIGKYISPDLYLGYRHVFGADDDENANEALLEYRISRRWLAAAVFGDAGVGGLDLFWVFRH